MARKIRWGEERVSIERRKRLERKKVKIERERRKGKSTRILEPLRSHEDVC